MSRHFRHPPSKPAPRTLSPRGYAAHRGCSLRSVQEAISAGRLTRSVKRTEGGRYQIDAGRADLEWAASTYADRVPLSGPAARDAEPADLQRSRSRLEMAKAQLAELDLAERRGEILDAREVEARMVSVFSSCRVKLLGIPSRVRQQDPTLTKGQLALIEATIREGLEDLAGTRDDQVVEPAA
jgi:phage terminase Nu1 subunit (DNA packaging protein)